MKQAHRVFVLTATSLALLMIASAGAAAGAGTPAGASKKQGAKAEEEKPLGPSTLSPIRAVPRGALDPLNGTPSRSLGTCSHGYLVDSVPLAPQDDTYRIIPSHLARKLHFGTTELVEAIPRVAARVAEQHPGAVLSVGNLSGRFGGPIRYSRSHQSGRDVDLGFYATDTEGKPVFYEGLARFRCDGRGYAPAEHLRFDVARNWALVRALVEEGHAGAEAGKEKAGSQVQVLFIAPCLRRRLLDHAKEIRAPREIVHRAATLMRRAGDHSFSHDDHYHVRLYCSRDDALTGCRNEGKIWPWVEVHEASLHKEALRLKKGLRAKSAERRAETLNLIAALDAKPLASRVARLIDDADPAVRQAAHAATAALASPDALPHLRRTLERTRKPDQALAILDTMAAFEGPARRTARVVEGVLTSPRDALAARLSDEQARDARVKAANALAFMGRRGSVWPLMRQLSADDPLVRRATERALSFLTNRAPRGALQDQPRALRRDWTDWWSEARHRAMWRNVRDGFREAGIDIDGSLRKWSAIPHLLSAVARGGHVSWNAQLLLRNFARENAPRITHDPLPASLPVWRAWVGSRLPVGALARYGAPAESPAPTPAAPATATTPTTVTGPPGE